MERKLLVLIWIVGATLVFNVAILLRLLLEPGPP
jgi:hypothetical protein